MDPMLELKMPTLGKAKLVGKDVVPVDDLFEWGRWFEAVDRHVRKTVLNRRRKIWVSTVFLGMDHNFMGGPRPLWFETMVFGTSINEAQFRYETWDEAERGHAEMVRRARQARQLPSVPLNPKKMGRMMKKFRRRFGSRQS